jgi:hypothetical protein
MKQGLREHRLGSEERPAIGDEGSEASLQAWPVRA